MFPALFARGDMCLLEMIFRGFCHNDIFQCAIGAGVPDNVTGPRAMNFGFQGICCHGNIRMYGFYYPEQPMQGGPDDQVSLQTRFGMNKGNENRDHA